MMEFESIDRVVGPSSMPKVKKQYDPNTVPVTAPDYIKEEAKEYNNMWFQIEELDDGTWCILIGWGN